MIVLTLNSVPRAPKARHIGTINTNGNLLVQDLTLKEVTETLHVTAVHLTAVHLRSNNRKCCPFGKENIIFLKFQLLIQCSTRLGGGLLAYFVFLSGL